MLFKLLNFWSNKYYLLYRVKRFFYKMAIFYHLDNGKWVMFMLNSTLSYVYKNLFSWLYICTLICLQRCARWKKSANSYSLFLPFRIPLVKWRPKLMTWALREFHLQSLKRVKIFAAANKIYTAAPTHYVVLHSWLL